MLLWGKDTTNSDVKSWQTYSNSIIQMRQKQRDLYLKLDSIHNIPAETCHYGNNFQVETNLVPADWTPKPTTDKGELYLHANGSTDMNTETLNAMNSAEAKLFWVRLRTMNMNETLHKMVSQLSRPHRSLSGNVLERNVLGDPTPREDMTV